MDILAGLDTEEMKTQLRIQSAILKCVDSLRENENSDETMGELLEIIGDFYDADRAYIFEFDDDMVLMHNTYEWCKEGVEPAIEMLADLEIKTIDRWFSYFEEQGEFYINSLSAEVSKDSAEHRILESQGIESLMAAPLKTDGRQVGFIAVDNPRENTGTLLLMQSVGSFVVNELHKRQTVEQRVLTTLSGIYIYIYIHDINDDALFEVTSKPSVRGFIKSGGNAAERTMAAAEALVHEDFIEEAREFYNVKTIPERLADAKNTSFEFLARSGHWCRATYIVMNRDKDGRPLQVISLLRYIDKEKRKELEYQRELKKALENQNEIYAEMLHMQGCGMIASTADTGKIITINDAALELLGLGSSPDLYESVFERIITDDKAKIRNDFLTSLRTNGKFSGEYAIERPDGQLIYVMSEVRLARLKGGDTVMVNSLMDITEKKKLEQELVLLSETDSLTDISNRRSGEAKIERLLAEGVSGMYCLLDVDKFKQINDDFGHSAGDRALVETARCLKKSFRSTDVVMRLGGDEFAVFAAGVENENQGVDSIKRFFRMLEEVEVPEMCGRKIEVSLGAVLCTAEDTDYDKIYMNADSAMYICKSKKGNYYNFFSKN